MTGIELLGTGRSLPGHCITNDDLARVVETSDEWVASRTGIRQRYFCTEEETAAQLAADAANKALAQAGVTAAQIGVCIVATFTPDHATPSLACEVHEALHLPETALCFDVNAACTGFLVALETARCHLAAGDVTGQFALVIGAEKISRLLDFADRSTCVLFGDGAGASVICLAKEAPYATTFGARGDASILYANADGDDPFLHMDGRAVFRFAVQIIPQCLDELLAKTGLQMADIGHVVCHQANSRIIDHVIKQRGDDPARYYQNMQRYGNTSAASIPLALDELRQNGALQSGQIVACIGFGAGLTWGGILLRV